MTKPETPGYRFVAILLGVDAGEQPNRQPDHRPGWWREFWTAMAGRAGAASDFARSRPNPDQAAAPESRDRDDPDDEGVNKLRREHAIAKLRARADADDKRAIAESQARAEASDTAALRKATARPWEEPVENVVRSLPPQSRRHARRIERLRQANDQLLASRVQDVLVECGLTRVDFSIGGGTLHTPRVISVDAGPPVRLTIRPLPGQTPDDFARQAPAIASHLGVAEVRLIPSGSSLIGLELLPKPD